MKIEFLPAAVDELIEAAEGYEGDVPGLGREFTLETERIVGVLAELPSLGRSYGIEPDKLEVESAESVRPKDVE